MDVRVGFLFASDGGGWAVAWEDLGFVGEGVEPCSDGAGELLEGATGEIGAADGACEEGVADEGEIGVGAI